MSEESERGLAPIPYFRAIVGHDPRPWQRRLYAALVGGEVPDAVDLPTGLGKTITVLVLVLVLARLRNAEVPRRSASPAGARGGREGDPALVGSIAQRRAMGDTRTRRTGGANRTPPSASPTIGTSPAARTAIS